MESLPQQRPIPAPIHRVAPGLAASPLALALCMFAPCCVRPGPPGAASGPGRRLQAPWGNRPAPHVCVRVLTWALLLLLRSHFSRIRLCATPETAAHQAPPSLGFSRQEHWSGLPFPSPVHESEKQVPALGAPRLWTFKG